MNIIQQILVNSYATLVMAKIMTIDQVPETKTIGGVDYPIYAEVEIEVAKRNIAILG